MQTHRIMIPKGLLWLKAKMIAFSCSIKSDTVPEGETCPWYPHFGESIAYNTGYVSRSHKYTHMGQARRSLDNCSDFQLDEDMRTRCNERFG
jgi:hypothetical protein